MTTCLGKSCTFGYQFFCVSFFPFGFEDGMLDLIKLIPEHCLSINFSIFHLYLGVLLLLPVLVG